MTTTTPVTGYEILVEGEGYKDLGEIFGVSLVTKSNKTGIQYFDGNVYTDLVDVFALYTSGIEKAQLTGYKSNNGTYAGKDLNEIFQIKLPYVITPITSTSGAYTTSKDASENTIITFTTGSCYITFSSVFSNKVEYTMYGGGAGGTAGSKGPETNSGGGNGGRGGGGGQIATDTFSYEPDTTYTINVGAGGAGGTSERYMQIAAKAGVASSIKKGLSTIVSAAGGNVNGGGAGGAGAASGSNSGTGVNGPDPNATTRAGGAGGAGGSTYNPGGAGNSGGGGTANLGGIALAGGGGLLAGGEANSGGGGGGGGGGRGNSLSNNGRPGGGGGSGVVILKIIK